MAVDLFTIILTAIMRAFCFNTGRNQAKQHSRVVDWRWLNKNMKDRLLNCFILTIFKLQYNTINFIYSRFHTTKTLAKLGYYTTYDT